MKHLIIFATEQEAQDTLKIADAKKTQNVKLYDFAKGHILICGMGPKATEESIKNHIQHYDLIVNFGIVGALREDISSHEIHMVSTVSNDTFHKIKLQNEGLRLLTVTEPLHDKEKRDAFSSDFDLVDMEGYVIAQYAAQHKKPCKMYKIISDFCKAGGPEEIKAKLPALSQKLSDHFSHII
jgi:nucleoside phosphorylase